MRHVFLTLVLLFSFATAVFPNDFDDGVAAFQSQDFWTALSKLFKTATSPDPSVKSSFDEWVTRARPLNPSASDEELREYWSAEYGSRREELRAWAQLYLGIMYHDGLGVTQDYQQAATWYSQAAQAGVAAAQVRLGTLYTKGEGVPRDFAKAFSWYQKAAEAGHSEGQFHLGVMYRKGQGIPRDDIQAAHWYTKAASQGVVEAQYNLGLMYNAGEGGPQDFVMAISWYRKAAEAGSSSAQLNLGYMYSHGQGVPQDYVQAHKWYNLAGSLATDEWTRDRAIGNRDIVERKMGPSQLAEAQRLAREWKPTTGSTTNRLWDGGRIKATASGTGFIVSRQGHVLTNHHVVEGCLSVRSIIEGTQKELTVIGTDVENDLAVLKLPTPVLNVARFREGRNIRSGDTVMVVGFPLRGLLASEANVTTGTVSALAGLGNDTRFIQITAPVQPGNSGGPLLDQSGNVVGVVVSKLDSLKIARVTGDIPQNINFAINGTVAKGFLDANGVEYETDVPTKKMEPADISAIAKQSTLPIECVR